MLRNLIFFGVLLSCEKKYDFEYLYSVELNDSKISSNYEYKKRGVGAIFVTSKSAESINYEVEIVNNGSKSIQVDEEWVLPKNSKVFSIYGKRNKPIVYHNDSAKVSFKFTNTLKSPVLIKLKVF